jgi:Holliday junction resolvase RusA-like endonuclease
VRELKLTVLGKPVPLSRVSAGQFGGRYLSGPTSRQIGNVVDAWERAGEQRFEDDQALRLDCSFYFERPASHFGTGRNAGELKTWAAFKEPTGRPDLSNLVKLVEDALNGNAFKDDSRIVVINAQKRYADRARTEIEIRWA